MNTFDYQICIAMIDLLVSFIIIDWQDVFYIWIEGSII